MNTISGGINDKNHVLFDPYHKKICAFNLLCEVFQT
jgi:hypothetical protein